MRVYLLLILLLLPAFANAETIRIDKRACRYVARHHPDADVAFKPGEGLHGKKVVPADLNPSPVGDLEGDMRIELTTDAAKIFDLKLPEIDKDGQKIPLAYPQIQNYIALKDGVPYLNGHPLESRQERELLVLCDAQKSQDKKH